MSWPAGLGRVMAIAKQLPNCDSVRRRLRPGNVSPLAARPNCQLRLLRCDGPPPSKVEGRDGGPEPAARWAMNKEVTYLAALVYRSEGGCGWQTHTRDVWVFNVSSIRCGSTTITLSICRLMMMQHAMSRRNGTSFERGMRAMEQWRDGAGRREMWQLMQAPASAAASLVRWVKNIVGSEIAEKGKQSRAIARVVSLEAGEIMDGTA